MNYITKTHKYGFDLSVVTNDEDFELTQHYNLARYHLRIKRQICYAAHGDDKVDIFGS